MKQLCFKKNKKQILTVSLASVINREISASYFCERNLDWTASKLKEIVE